MRPTGGCCAKNEQTNKQINKFSETIPKKLFQVRHSAFDHEERHVRKQVRIIKYDMFKYHKKNCYLHTGEQVLFFHLPSNSVCYTTITLRFVTQSCRTSNTCLLCFYLHLLSNDYFVYKHNSWGHVNSPYVRCVSVCALDEQSTVLTRSWGQHRSEFKVAFPATRNPTSLTRMSMLTTFIQACEKMS